MTAASEPLRGRTAVVTGAARGLGAAVARELSQRGASVALVGREGSALAAVRDSLDGPGRCWEVDVTDEGAMRRVARDVRAEMGPASVVVANAGIAEGGPFEMTDPSLWRRVIEVNLIGSAVTARSFIGQLRATHGYYLQIASMASLGAAPMMSAYCASKAGVESFAHALRAEYAHQGVGVGIAYLGWIDTDMVRDVDDRPVLRELRARMPRPARRVHPAPEVAARMVRTVERRNPAVYVPSWLRAGQPVRAALPLIVTFLSRRELPRLARRTGLEPTGPLGPGGRADVEGRAAGTAGGQNSRR
ncbi:SDR family oxidoreductase [Streptomyces sp. NPDC087659]|uniref:SDR family oxidoreductase n=1 Tax=unclassified Streptomyces TaxID=2593676 RepID=UPI0036EEC1D4